MARQGRARRAWVGFPEVWLGGVGRGFACRGMARPGWSGLGVVRSGRERLALVRPGMAMAWLGDLRMGWVGRGRAPFQFHSGVQRRAEAWRGRAR